jgi:hypothetical protein
MASSTAEPSGELPAVAVTVGPAELTRTVEWVEQGAIVTFELGSDGAEPTRVRLEQPLPADLPVSDAGFRQDAEPAEWSVEDGVVSGTADAPVDAHVEFVLGMKFSESAPASASFPEPTLSEAEGASVAVDDSRVVGDDDSGALAETVRQVIGGADDGDAAADGGRWQEAGGGGTTTDADEPTPRDLPADPDADDLEAAVAAVEAELDDGAGDGADDDGAEDGTPELDLSVPGDDGPTDDAVDDGDSATDADATVAGGVDVPAPDEVDATTGNAERSPVDIAEGLADADEADRRAVREALDLEASGTVAVRLRDLESRLSAFEAYEDALAEFIDDTGTAAEVREAATAAEAAAAAAAESVEAIREDVAAVETELAAVREEAEAAHAAAEAAREERASLREDLDELRADVDEAAGLRAQLLDALSESGAGSTGAD